MISDWSKVWWVEIWTFSPDALLDPQRQDVLTADGVENFLRQNEIPVQADKGGVLKIICVALVEPDLSCYQSPY
jgi:hypothetical protein